jgi:hypothetical protein
MQRRTYSFRLVMTSDERQLLTDVAEHLRRSESDTVRWLVAEAAERYELVRTVRPKEQLNARSQSPVNGS